MPFNGMITAVWQKRPGGSDSLPQQTRFHKSSGSGIPVHSLQQRRLPKIHKVRPVFSLILLYYLLYPAAALFSAFGAALNTLRTLFSNSVFSFDPAIIFRYTRGRIEFAL